MLKSAAQPSLPSTEAVNAVAVDWIKDSTSCLGLRYRVYQSILKSKPDFLIKEQLFKKLGTPNITRKYFSGITKKNYVEHIYYIYKDNCPKINVEGYGIGFIYDELETGLLEIELCEFCG
jgi:hypothetical protein